MNSSEKLLLETIIQREVASLLLEQGIVQRVKQGVVEAGQKTIEAMIQQFDGLVKKVQGYKNNPDIMEIYNLINKSGSSVAMPQDMNAFQNTIQQWDAATKNLKSQTGQIAERKLFVAKKHNNILKEAQAYFAEADKLFGSERKLLEFIDPLTLGGITLAGLKLISLIGSGLEKLGVWLQKSQSDFWKAFGKFCSWIGHLFHYAHKAEEAIIDRSVPDKLSYYIYQAYWKVGKGQDLHKKYLKLGNNKGTTVASKEDIKTAGKLADLQTKEASGAMSYEDWQKDTALRPKLEATIFQIYILILFISALPTVYHIIHGFWSHGISGAISGAHGSVALAAAEPTAASVKAGELVAGGRAAATVASELAAGAVARSIA